MTASALPNEFDVLECLTWRTLWQVCASQVFEYMNESDTGKKEEWKQRINSTRDWMDRINKGFVLDPLPVKPLEFVVPSAEANWRLYLTKQLSVIFTNA